MNVDEIRDECRKNLNKYTIRAFSAIPPIAHPVILDAGCGTGVPSLALLEMCDGLMYAVDPDRSSLNWFQEKVKALKLNSRITIINDSILNPSLFDFKFDVVLAEGLLNVIGFERGLPLLAGYLKKGGYLLIHDEFKNDSNKRRLFKENNLKLLDLFVLDKDVWWNEYYSCLEIRIKGAGSEKLFENEIKEINDYKTSPERFKSIYYVLRHAE